MKHSRQILIKDWDQSRISSKAVLLAGCGAIGSITGMKLARLGVKRIIAVDHDMLEEHNLENQLYTKRDIGKPKVIALRKIIRDIDRIEFEPYIRKIEESPVEAFEPDVYLSCFDNFSSRFYLNDVAVLNKKPMIDAGIQGFSGTVRLIIPGKTPCLRCWDSLIPEPKLSASCSKAIPSTFITASHASDLMIMQLINLIFDWNVDPFIFFDLKTNHCSPVSISINPDCMCGGLNEG